MKFISTQFVCCTLVAWVALCSHATGAGQRSADELAEPAAETSEKAAEETPDASESQNVAEQPDESEGAAEEETGAKPEDADADAGDDAAKKALKPRFQVTLKSLSQLREALDRSALGPLAYHLAEVIAETNQRESDGIAQETALAILESLRDWPDCETQVAIFGPDLEGRPRIIKRVTLPIGQVHDLIQDMFEDERLESFFEGAELEADGDRFVFRVGGEVLGYLVADGTSATTVLTHEDLELPEEFFQGSPGDADPLMAAQLLFEKTDKDSGETFLSKLTLVQSVDYTLRAKDDGNWLGELRVNWAPALGLVVKPIVARTRQTFFVPEEAFAGAVAKVTGTSASLDEMLGFEDETPLAGRLNDDLCVVVLPGTGFVPAPDVILQCRINDTEDFADDLKTIIKKLNRKAKKQDRKPDWHHAELQNRDVFWSDQHVQGQAALPILYRPVFFVQSAKDAKDRDRDFLVVGWTTTDQRDLVERWLDIDRGDEARFLPSDTGLNGDAWLNWKEIYAWVLPYVNTAMSGLGPEFVISDEIGEQIEAGSIKLRIKYQGIRVEQDGPVPLGVLSLPSLISASFQERSGSDLSRERLGVRRLRLLYHHSKLFHQDIGRWPSQVAELDGYIDFAGHSYLLKLESSPKKRWSDFMEQLLDPDKDDDEDEPQEADDDDMYASIDDSLYVVSWNDDGEWSLGFEEDKFDHLKRLYIDEQGEIHRVEKSPEEAGSDESDEDTDDGTETNQEANEEEEVAAE